MERWTAKGVAGAALALCVGLCAAGPARADGLAFEGDLPAAEHLLLDLTPVQRQALALAARKGEGWPEVTLSAAQRRALKKAFGVEPRWVFAVERQALDEVPAERTWGLYNLGIRSGDRLAVLRQGLGDRLGRRDVAAMEQALIDRRLAVAGPTPLLDVTWWLRSGEPPEALQRLAAMVPAAAADGAVRLPKGWTAQRLRLADVPRLDEDRKDPAHALHALAAIAGQPSAASVLRWPELGARREAGGSVLWLVPGTVRPGPGLSLRGWFLLEYRGGRLVAVVATAGEERVGATYLWEEPG